MDFGIAINGKSKKHPVSQIVYETFVGTIPDKTIIRHKNGDPFDNTPKNLYPISIKEVIREMIFGEVVVSQYDREGNYIKTYRSITHAAKAVGAHPSNLDRVIQGKNIFCKGYYWRKGDSKDKIDMSFLKERIRQGKLRSSKGNSSKKVVQYDLTRKFIAVYSSIKKAMAQTGLSRFTIVGVLNGNRYFGREFIWKYANLFDEIPDRIEPDRIEVKLPEPVVFPKSRKEMNLSEYEYPYQDLHLCDMENEVWKAVPGLKKYCMVSDRGRVRALPRFMDKPYRGQMILKERIIKQKIQKLKRKQQTVNLNRGLCFSIRTDNTLYEITVARAVYSAFIQPLKNFKENKIYIFHRDLNPLNNRVENLYAATTKASPHRAILAT